MEEFTAAEAGRRLEELLDRALTGDAVVITSLHGRRIRLVPTETRSLGRPKRSFGAFKGKLRIDERFFEPLPSDELANWDNSDEDDS